MTTTPDPLRAALREIAGLPGDRLDEAPEIARRGLVRADSHGYDCLCTECMEERFGPWVQPAQETSR